MFLHKGAIAQSSSEKAYSVEVVAGEFNFPWSLAFLPDGDFLVTERNGTLKHVTSKGDVTTVGGLESQKVAVAGQGGLLDVVLDPGFPVNQTLYIALAWGEPADNALRVVRAKLDANRLVDVTPIFTAGPNKKTPVHYGGRMAFLPDGTLLITSGDGFDYREDAQRVNNHLGKILRINTDGTPAADNPFTDQGELAKAVFSLGHRNPQAVLFDPIRRVIFSHEHGPAGGDEVNIIEPGVNYGWPIVTNGKDYSGASISPFTEYPGMKGPWIDWTPSIAPSGMAVYYGQAFPELNGHLLVTSLKDKNLRIIELNGLDVLSQQLWMEEESMRLRDVRVGPDGNIYLLTDEAAGKVLKLAPTRKITP